jgi:hypothetical protein
MSAAVILEVFVKKLKTGTKLTHARLIFAKI